MSANPITDQLAATVRDLRHTGPDPEMIDKLAKVFATTLVTSLPDVDPALIGEVVLHVSAGMGLALTVMETTGWPASLAVGTSCNLISSAGEYLYTGTITSKEQ